MHAIPVDYEFPLGKEIPPTPPQGPATPKFQISAQVFVFPSASGADAPQRSLTSLGFKGSYKEPQAPLLKRCSEARGMTRSISEMTLLSAVGHLRGTAQEPLGTRSLSPKRLSIKGLKSGNSPQCAGGADRPCSLNYDSQAPVGVEVTDGSRSGGESRAVSQPTSARMSPARSHTQSSAAEFAPSDRSSAGSLVHDATALSRAGVDAAAAADGGGDSATQPHQPCAQAGGPSPGVPLPISPSPPLQQQQQQQQQQWPRGGRRILVIGAPPPDDSRPAPLLPPPPPSAAARSITTSPAYSPRASATGTSLWTAPASAPGGHKALHPPPPPPPSSSSSPSPHSPASMPNPPPTLPPPLHQRPAPIMTVIIPTFQGQQPPAHERPRRKRTSHLQGDLLLGSHPSPPASPHSPLSTTHVPAGTDKTAPTRAPHSSVPPPPAQAQPPGASSAPFPPAHATFLPPCTSPRAAAALHAAQLQLQLQQQQALHPFLKTQQQATLSSKPLPMFPPLSRIGQAVRGAASVSPAYAMDAGALRRNKTVL